MRAENRYPEGGRVRLSNVSVGACRQLAREGPTGTIPCFAAIVTRVSIRLFAPTVGAYMVQVKRLTGIRSSYPTGRSSYTRTCESYPYYPTAATTPVEFLPEYVYTRRGELCVCDMMLKCPEKGLPVFFILSLDVCDKHDLPTSRIARWRQ